MSPEEALHDAIQTYARAIANENRVLTHYVLCAATLDLHTAGESSYYTIAGTGPYHVRRGLIDILEEETAYPGSDTDEDD